MQIAQQKSTGITIIPLLLCSMWLCPCEPTHNDTDGKSKRMKCSSKYFAYLCPSKRLCAHNNIRIGNSHICHIYSFYD